MTRDAETIEHARSVLEAAEREWDGRLITAPSLPFHPASTYAETHFALAATALALLGPAAYRWLDLAANRLRLWNEHRGPATFFNAMAVCLIRITLDRAGARHTALDDVLRTIIARTNEHRRIAYDQWSGNNCYLQQVVVDLVLLPLARNQTLPTDVAGTVADEFLRYRTEEGFFFDLPREGGAQERLVPPTYVMKILFLLALCQELAPDSRFEELFRQGMDACLPLLTRHGSFCYFGRTDNSPFAAGLTIFNLRKAASMNPAAGFLHALAQADEYLRSFPRTESGLLQCNRFGAGSQRELVFSRDMYAKVGEYSVAACAYSLLACWLFPLRNDTGGAALQKRAPMARSTDLEVVRLSAGDDELLVRTAGQITSWDRRYLGPTILRFERAETLLVGAIAKTVSTDDGVETSPHGQKVLAAKISALKSWYVRGLEQLDATTVGFVPVIRAGAVDYLPYRVLQVSTTESSVEIRYGMLRLHARGVAACAVELRERLRRQAPWIKRGEYGPPFMRNDESFECVREIALVKGECRIRDRIKGELRGKSILLSTRSFPAADIRVSGLQRRETFAAWSSDGKQEIAVYFGRSDSGVIDYECVVARAR